MNLEARLTEYQPKPAKRQQVCAVVSVFILLFLAGCASTPSNDPISGVTQAEKYKTHTEDVKTISGRAWVSVRVDGKKASFSGVVLIDRTEAKKGKIRLEALDPFGMLHHLIVLDGEQKTLVWTDHDEKVVRTAQNSLRGMPLAILPNLLAGVSPLSELESLELSYVVADRGGINVLKTVSGKITDEQADSKESIVAVLYEKFSTRKEYDLPKSVSMNIGEGVSITLDWRSRAINKDLRPELFTTEAEEGYRAIDF